MWPPGMVRLRLLVGSLLLVRLAVLEVCTGTGWSGNVLRRWTEAGVGPWPSQPLAILSCVGGFSDRVHGWWHGFMVSELCGRLQFIQQYMTEFMVSALCGRLGLFQCCVKGVDDSSVVRSTCCWKRRRGG
jgi:hypothetical protein